MTAAAFVANQREMKKAISGNVEMLNWSFFFFPKQIKN